MSTRLFLTALLAVALTTITSAQEQPAAPEATQPAAPAVAIEGAAPTQSSVSRDRDTLSVDFPDEEIKTILRNVADLFEINLVVPDTLTGKTSIKLRDVTWRQIFQVILSPVGYTYVEEGNIIKVVSNESLQQEPTTTDVILINNARAEDLRPTISGLIDSAAGGKIEINARSNALIITERPSRMSRIRETIEKLDRATDQVMIETKFVEVTDRDIRNIGVNWASLDRFQVGVGQISQKWERARGQTRDSSSNASNGSNSGSTNTSGSSSSNSTTNGTNTSTSNGTTSATSNGTNSSTNNGTTSSTTVGTTGGDAVTYVTGFDAPIPSVTSLPSGAVTPSITSVPSTTFLSGTAPDYTASTTYTGSTQNEVTNGTTGSTSNGTTGSTSNGTTGSTTNGTSGSTSNSLTETLANTLTEGANNTLSNLMGLTNTGSTNRLASAVFSASDFNIVLSALKTQNNTKVVSNPTVVTLNNTEAMLNIGSEFPIPSYTYNAERGTFEVSGFQYKPIGVILKVTPQVNSQGLIRMTLEPEISQQADSTTFGGAGGASIPIISTRKVKTQVSLKDGYTVGLGGLLSTTKSHGGNKVPLLGDIPGLGRLFSSKNVNDTTTNLLIFLTARTVSSDGAVPSEIFSASSLNTVGTDAGPSMPAKK